MEMYQLFQEEQQQLKTRLHALVTLGGTLEDDAIEDICDELLFCMEVEEEFLYPVFQQFRETRGVIENALAAHLRARNIIADIFQCKSATAQLKQQIERHIKNQETETMLDLILNGKSESEKVRQKLVALLDIVRQHMEMEEKLIFPLIHQRFSPDEARFITERINSIKTDHCIEKIA